VSSTAVASITGLHSSNILTIHRAAPGAFQACLTWLDQEFGLTADESRPQEPVNLAVEVAGSMSEHLRLSALSELRHASTTTIFDGMTYTDVCLLDRTPQSDTQHLSAV
jgi:hypothetical protein